MTGKAIIVPEALHALWKAEAAKQGVPLSTYVVAAVEGARTGELRPEPVTRKMPVMSARTVKPKDCTNRVSPGTFCKTCGSVHAKTRA